MPADYKLIPTTADVYMAITRQHGLELVPFLTISQPEGSPHGDPEQARMYTAWGFKSADYPTIAHDETWRHDQERPGVRTDRRVAYFLCAARRPFDLL